jgi:hypothetical protein
VRCPACGGVATLFTVERFVAQPVGSFSLAGAQMKVSAHKVVLLWCDRCPLELVGHR